MAVASLRQSIVPELSGNVCTPIIGKVTAVLPDGRVHVVLPGSAGGLPARGAAGLADAASGRLPCDALLVFEHGDAQRPVVVTLLEPVGPASGTDHRAPPAAHVVRLGRLTGNQACLVDGRKVVIEAQDEVVLRCGQGSITLQADGRIVLKGREIVSRAFEANRIKGSTVRIN